MLYVIPQVDGIKMAEGEIDRLFWWKCKPCAKKPTGGEHGRGIIRGTDSQARQHEARHGFEGLVVCIRCKRSPDGGHGEPTWEEEQRDLDRTIEHYKGVDNVVIVNRAVDHATVDEAEVFLWNCRLCEREEISFTTREALAHAFEHYSSDAVKCTTCNHSVGVDHAKTHKQLRVSAGLEERDVGPSTLHSLREILAPPTESCGSL